MSTTYLGLYGGPGAPSSYLPKTPAAEGKAFTWLSVSALPGNIHQFISKSAYIPPTSPIVRRDIGGGTGWGRGETTGFSYNGYLDAKFLEDLATLLPIILN